MDFVISAVLLSIFIAAFIPNVAKVMMMLTTAHYHALCAYISEFSKAIKEENWQ